MQKFDGLSLSAIEKFVAENAGECMDIIEGSLIDNVVYSFSFGTMFCFETYANEWNSKYTILFFHKARERGIRKAWERFDSLREIA